MKTTKALVDAVKRLSVANAQVTEIQHEIADKKMETIRDSKVYAECKNEKERTAELDRVCGTLNEKLRKAESLKAELAVEKEIADIEWRSEKYDILATVKAVV